MLRGSFLIVFLLFAGCSQSPSEDPSALFAHEVYPLLEAKCFACHGDDPEEVEAEFDIRSRAGMLAGGESGRPALIPGKPDQSPIYQAITWVDPDLEMPPKENDRLTPAQIDRIHQWIEAGAPWPSDEERAGILANTEWDYADGIRVATSDARSAAWASRRYKPEDLWGFMPMQEVATPEGGHPIDAFIERRLKAEGLKAAAQADKLTLVRRATYDLTGLPPTPEEIDAFLADASSDAFEHLVDRLLASPRYGEQWGRHWLDVVRYADTDGFANDYERPNAWRYRDYVIRAFNDDKPYDRFLIEQLAGDELDPTDPENLIAAGFLRMGPWEHTGMSIEAVTRQLFLDDVTNSVGETFMALPLRCASCHDHKFDPIPTKDYYQIQAAFAPVQFVQRPTPFLPEENRAGFAASSERLERLIDEAELARKEIAEKEEAAARAWMAQRGIPYVSRNERRTLPDHQRPPRYYGLDYDDLGYQKVLNKHMQVLRLQRDRYAPVSYSVYNGPLSFVHSVRHPRLPDEPPAGEPQPTFILTGGSVYSPDEQVGPGILSAVGALSDRDPSVTQIPEATEGRRLALAEWLTQPDHPLTARVMVNRIWQYHFGKGLAGNPNNFGVMGKKPTHPELLDWLAQQFVEQRWSVKEMHRLIMTSAAYQRSGWHSRMERIREQDPDNNLLAYFSPRRLEAEELRDAMLAVSGELNTEMGGLPIRPEINLEVALQPRHIMGSVAPAYQPSLTPEARNRRTIYAYRARGLANPMLEVFNQPSADLSCERRTASTVTPQAFTLMNSETSRSRAVAMASRVAQEATMPAERVQRAITLAWNREATDAEVERSIAYLTEMEDHHAGIEPERRIYPTSITRKMFEEMTGEPFEYEEKLDIYENYVPDLEMADLSPDVRALADFCLVLFNANEFVYVY